MLTRDKNGTSSNSSCTSMDCILYVRTQQEWDLFRLERRSTKLLKLTQIVYSAECRTYNSFIQNFNYSSNSKIAGPMWRSYRRSVGFDLFRLKKLNKQRATAKGTGPQGHTASGPDSMAWLIPLTGRCLLCQRCVRNNRASVRNYAKPVISISTMHRATCDTVDAFAWRFWTNSHLHPTDVNTSNAYNESVKS